MNFQNQVTILDTNSPTLANGSGIAASEQATGRGSNLSILRIFSIVGDNGMSPVDNEDLIKPVIAKGLLNVEIVEFNQVYPAIMYSIARYCARFMARNYHLQIFPSYPANLMINMVFIDPDFENRERRGNSTRPFTDWPVHLLR